MPELPDVEGYRNALARTLPASRIRSVQVLDDGVLRNATAEEFVNRIIGCEFQQPYRRGKWLILPTDGPTVLIHNGMTGRPYFTTMGADADADADPETDRDDRLVISTDLGDLHYADRRKLRGVWIVDEESEVAAVIGEQGPDALNLSARSFRDALRGRRGAVKTTLMNQRVIAGLGNMLSDEICWRARLHPSRAVTSISDEEFRELHRATQRVLRAAVQKGRIPRTRSWLSASRDRDPACCPRCKTTLRRTTIGGRTSIWCPHCQPDL
jgi:formamidopyrimidine-DNA glycosylase